MRRASSGPARARCPPRRLERALEIAELVAHLPEDLHSTGRGARESLGEPGRCRGDARWPGRGSTRGAVGRVALEESAPATREERQRRARRRPRLRAFCDAQPALEPAPRPRVPRAREQSAASSAVPGAGGRRRREPRRLPSGARAPRARAEERARARGSPAERAHFRLEQPATIDGRAGLGERLVNRAARASTDRPRARRPCAADQHGERGRSAEARANSGGGRLRWRRAPATRSRRRPRRRSAPQTLAPALRSARAGPAHPSSRETDEARREGGVIGPRRQRARGLVDERATFVLRTPSRRVRGVVAQRREHPRRDDREQDRGRTL